MNGARSVKNLSRVRYSYTLIQVKSNAWKHILVLATITCGRCYGLIKFKRLAGNDVDMVIKSSSIGYP